MSKVETVKLPQMGDKILANKFFVSKMNVRVDEAFGETDKDKALSEHLKWRDIVQPFKARPEDENGHWELGMDLSRMKGYGVYVGRRRFLGKMEAGMKEFEVGKDCIIEEKTDEEALDESLRENLDLFHADLNPIAKAKAIARIIDMRLASLRSLARLWRIPASTLSDWLKPLELTPKLQDAVAKGLVLFTEALQIARLKLGKEKQDELAEIVEADYQAFRKELARLRAGKGRKRGIPRGKFTVDRLMWDKHYPPDMELRAQIEKLAKSKSMEIEEYIKKEVLPEHIKRVA